MASTRPLYGKDGRITCYEICVANGRDLNGKQIRHTMRWVPEPNMTPAKAEKAVRRVADDFEDRIKRGGMVDSKITFAAYAADFIQRKEKVLKHRTVENYRYLLERTNAAIGHIKLQELRPGHITSFLDNLREGGIRQDQDRAITNKLVPLLQKKKLSREKLAAMAGLSVYTIDMAAHGKRIKLASAEKIAAALNMPLTKLFTVMKSTKPLSGKTILEYFSMIHTILKDAYKAGYIDFVVTDRVDRPKAESHEVEALQPAELAAVLKALECEDIPLKWKVIVHLLIITGCRRGEIIGLRWSKIDWQNRKILIDSTLIYSTKKGLYVNSAKTGKPRRITIPAETVELLKEYRRWYDAEKASYGELWQRATQESKQDYERQWRGSDFMFVQEGGWPMHPDSVGGWLAGFTKANHLPPINPHKFRHTQASLLIYSGADVVSVAKRLGHAQVSTTTDIYAHIIEDADEQNAESIADAVLRAGKSG
ncbi:MAG: tyrosine-type recombinase/integrase [Oscillospiraceae bacterium]